jgi:hypothetical protein
MFFLFEMLSFIILVLSNLHRTWYLDRFQQASFQEKEVSIPEYEHVIDFLHYYQGGGVIYTSDTNYGFHLANQLRQDSYIVLHACVPPNVTQFDAWFGDQFKNRWWWSDRVPVDFLRESNLVMILDHYDNLFDHHPKAHRRAHTDYIAIIYSSDWRLIKPIFILHDKSHANEVLQYNFHAKYSNLLTGLPYGLV